MKCIAKANIELQFFFDEMHEQLHDNLINVIIVFSKLNNEIMFILK